MSEGLKAKPQILHYVRVQGIADQLVTHNCQQKQLNQIMLCPRARQLQCHTTIRNALNEFIHEILNATSMNSRM